MTPITSISRHRRTLLATALAVSLLALLAAAGPAALAQPTDVSVDRSVDPGEVTPNGTATVSLEVTFAAPRNVTITETFAPAFAEVTVLEADGATDVSVDPEMDALHLEYVNATEVSVTYEVRTGDGETTTVHDIDGAVTGDVAADLGSGEVTVMRPPTYEVTDLSVPTDVTQHEPFDVGATVVNTGDDAGNQSVELRIDGTVVDSVEPVELAPGASTDIVFPDRQLSMAGNRTIEVSTVADGAQTTVSVAETSASAFLPDQLLGSVDGVPAIAIEGVTASSGWSLVVTNQIGGGTAIVAAVEPIERDLEGETVHVTFDEVDPRLGPHEVLLVPPGDDPELGSPVPSEVDPVAFDLGFVLDGSITVDDHELERGASTVTVESASLHDAETNGGRPFFVGIYRVLDGVPRFLVGQSSALSGTANDVTIDLGEDVHPDEEYVARIHLPQLGDIGEPLPRVTDESFALYGESFSVSVVDRPVFEVQTIDAPASVPADGTATIDVGVTNVGETAGFTTMWVSIGESVELVEVSLEAGETRSYAVSVATAEEADQLPVLVDVGDDARSFNLAIDGPGIDTPTPSDAMPGFAPAMTAVAMLVVAVVALTRRRR